MSRPIPFCSIVVLAICGCSPSPPAASVSEDSKHQVQKPAAAETQAADVGNFIVGQPVRHANLTVFPILSKTPQTADRFITLDEGLKAGTVEILEVGAAEVVTHEDEDGPAVAQRPMTEDDVIQQAAVESLLEQLGGNEVNRLMVVNRSDKPLYLMPGEVIVGGSQDRTIAEERLVQATGKPEPIDVYCVEHGRWGERLAEDAIGVFGSIVAEPEAVEHASKSSQGKFPVTVGCLSKSIRLATQAGEGQSAVWDGVAAANAETGVVIASGAFTENYVDADVMKQLQPYLDELTEPVAAKQNVVGAIVAINGKTESVDVFESTPLFTKLWPKLLKSYALDAVVAADEKAAKATCSMADAGRFLNDVMQANVEKTDEVEGGLVVTQRSTDDVVSFSTEDAGGGFGGMGGGGVHTAGFAK